MSVLTRLYRTSVVSPDNAPGQYPPGYVPKTWDTPPPICPVDHNDVLYYYALVCNAYPDTAGACDGPHVGALLARPDGWVYQYQGGTTWVPIFYDASYDIRDESPC